MPLLLMTKVEGIMMTGGDAGRSDDKQNSYRSRSRGRGMGRGRRRSRRRKRRRRRREEE